MTWLDRAVVLAVVLLLSLQLTLSGRHKDDHIGYGDNCPSCVFAHHVPSGLPEASPPLLPVLAAHSYRLLRVAIRQAPSGVSFLIPESQAPPRG